MAQKSRPNYHRRQIDRGVSAESVERDMALEAKGMAYNKTNKGEMGRVHADSADEVMRRMLSGEEGAGRGHRTPGGIGWNAPGIEGLRQWLGKGVVDAKAESAYGRDLQRQALGMMLGAAQGTGPSVAGAMHTQGMRNALGDSLSMARASRGNAALAQRNALAAHGAMSANANLAGAQLRAKEIADARSALMSGAAGYSGMSLQEQLAYENLWQNMELASVNSALANRKLEMDETAMYVPIGGATADATGKAIGAA